MSNEYSSAELETDRPQNNREMTPNKNFKNQILD